VIFAGRLTGLKARIKLMVALACTNDDKKLRAIFQESD
jgi:L-asparaginase/Glu-tRNA(Gln) amidotransferase subunit D